MVPIAIKEIYSTTYCIKTIPQEHRFMQSQRDDLSTFNDEVTFTKWYARVCNKIHKDTLEPLLQQSGYVMVYDLRPSTSHLRERPMTKQINIHGYVGRNLRWLRKKCRESLS